MHTEEAVIVSSEDGEKQRCYYNVQKANLLQLQVFFSPPVKAKPRFLQRAVRRLLRLVGFAEVL